MFTNISGLSTLLMGLGFIVFIGFTFYDTSRVVRDNFYANDAVSPAINLLYDFVMLFRYALYFMGGRD
jgi:FtsH-binding integral membrane protein